MYNILPLVARAQLLLLEIREHEAQHRYEESRNQEEEPRVVRRRRQWVTPYLTRRDESSLHRNIFMELCLEDPNRFRRCLRMDSAQFQELLNLVTPHIRRQETTFRRPISPEQRLSLTLRYLATGESQEDLRTSFRIGQSTISGIIKETVAAIQAVLEPNYLRPPGSEEEWLNVARQFEALKNFPHCIGAVDGKHVRIQAPIQSGSSFYNYKDFFSIVLFAVVDVHLRFIYVDIGRNGRMSDSGVFNMSRLKSRLEEGSLHIPHSRPLVAGGPALPFVFVADQGLPLKPYMLVPFSERDVANNMPRRAFNYWESRCRMPSENAFGVLAARFRIFQSAMRCDPDEAARRVHACCCLHNWLRTSTVGANMYTPPGFVDEEVGDENRPGGWRHEAPPAGLLDVSRQGGNRRSRQALEIRQMFCDYLNSHLPLPQHLRPRDGC